MDTLLIAIKKYILSNDLRRSDWIKYIYKNMDKFDANRLKIFLKVLFPSQNLNYGIQKKS